MTLSCACYNTWTGARNHAMPSCVPASRQPDAGIRNCIECRHCYRQLLDTHPAPSPAAPPGINAMHAVTLTGIQNPQSKGSMRATAAKNFSKRQYIVYDKLSRAEVQAGCVRPHGEHVNMAWCDSLNRIALASLRMFLLPEPNSSGLDATSVKKIITAMHQLGLKAGAGTLVLWALDCCTMLHTGSRP